MSFENPLHPLWCRRDNKPEGLDRQLHRSGQDTANKVPWNHNWKWFGRKFWGVSSLYSVQNSKHLWLWKLERQVPIEARDGKLWANKLRKIRVLPASSEHVWGDYNDSPVEKNRRIDFRFFRFWDQINCGAIWPSQPSKYRHRKDH